MSHKKVPTFGAKNISQIGMIQIYLKLKVQSIYVIFLAVQPALEISANLALQKFHDSKMTSKLRKILTKLKRTTLRTDQ